MPKPQQDEQRTDQAARGSRQRDTLIGNHVLRTLGHPSGLQAVQVRHLWDDYYRVNVLVGGDAASVKVAHSYFLVTDSNGSIVTSTPEVTRQY
jgi:hypothetical protein